MRSAFPISCDGWSRKGNSARRRGRGSTVGTREAVIDGYRVCDVHVHIQPWEMHPPAVAAAIEAGRKDLDRIQAFTKSPRAFLEHLDAFGIERAAIINYVAPDVMGFTHEVNAWCAKWCAEAPD